MTAASAGTDRGPANVARIYGFLLGGKDNFAAGRRAAAHLAAAKPELKLRLWADPAVGPSWVIGGILTATRQCISGGTLSHQDHTLRSHAVRDGVARAGRVLGIATGRAAHGARVAQMLLPGILSYQPGITAHFGPDARNGRGLRDPSAEVMISLMLGTHVPPGLDASSAAGSPRATFPYPGAPVTLAERAGPSW